MRHGCKDGHRVCCVLIESITIRYKKMYGLLARKSGLLAPELAAGITRIRGVKSKGVRVGYWLRIPGEGEKDSGVNVKRIPG